MKHDVQRRGRFGRDLKKINKKIKNLFSYHQSPETKSLQQLKLTYARTRLHGVAREEADLLRRQDLALQPHRERDNGVRCVKSEPITQATISRQKQIGGQIFFRTPVIRCPSGGWQEGGRTSVHLPSFLPSFLNGDRQSSARVYEPWERSLAQSLGGVFCRSLHTLFCFFHLLYKIMFNVKTNTCQIAI